jgi:5-methylcytosine-specific restriction endonuclease McrBC GTP-binding regulatory subunit McrB
MTIEEFEETIESFKREYLTIVKKIGPDHIWMAPHKNDWYHSQYFVIDIKRNLDAELELSLNVNDLNPVDKTLTNRLGDLKRYLQKENFKFETILEAKTKFQEISHAFPFVLDNKKNELVYSEKSTINNIEDKLAKFNTKTILNNSKNRTINNTPEVERIFGDLHLNDEIKKSFYNGLKSKGFVILAGISGIGKTKIFENFVRNFPKDNYVFVPIRPDFRDTKSLLGFFNPLSEEYQVTPLLKLIVDASNDTKTPYFVLFDEMNLARVEYYFADFLSVLESQRDSHGFTTSAIQLHNSMSDKVRQQGVPREIKLPPNLYFVGSVNIDETTHMFSPKVIDRAFTIEFNVGSFKNYIKFLESSTTNKDNHLSPDLKKRLKKDFINQGEYTIINKDEDFVELAKQYFEDLEEINAFLPQNLKFGYRVFDEIISFMINSENSILQFTDTSEAFDIAVKMKVLPRFHGTRDKLERVFDELLEFTESRGLVHTAKKVKQMRENLQNIGYTSFM